MQIKYISFKQDFDNIKAFYIPFDKIFPKNKFISILLSFVFITYQHWHLVYFLKENVAGFLDYQVSMVSSVDLSCKQWRLFSMVCLIDV